MTSLGLARGFGGLLRFERGRARLTQVELAGRAGLHPNTVYLLEAGLRLPSTTSIWRIARALRPRVTCTLRDAVAVDQRLRDAAGSSLRYYGTRTRLVSRCAASCWPRPPGAGRERDRRHGGAARGGAARGPRSAP